MPGNEAGALYLFFTRTIPEFEDPAETIWIEAEGEGDGPEEPTFPPDEELEYVKTLVSTVEDAASLEAAVNAWWSDLTGCPVQLERIADTAASMSEDEAERLRALDGADWSINPIFVAYRFSSRESREAVIAFIRQHSLSLQ